MTDEHCEMRDVSRRADKRIMKAIAFGCAASIFLLSLVGGDWRPHTILPNYLEHALAYLTTGIVLTAAYRPRQRFRRLVLLGLSSGLLEVAQGYVPGREPSSIDAIASISGLTLGFTLGSLLIALAPRTRSGSTTALRDCKG